MKRKLRITKYELQGNPVKGWLYAAAATAVLGLSIASTYQDRYILAIALFMVSVALFLAAERTF